MTNLVLRKTLIALTLSGLAASNASWAAGADDMPKSKAPKEAGIGLGSGLAIGAAAGGPIGAILGAAFGGWLGERFHQEKSGRVDAESRQHEAAARVGALEATVASEERKSLRLAAELERERSAHRVELAQALAIEVFFRTEDSTLGAEIEARLADLARFIAPMDGTLVHLEGHADGRGEESYNAQLSAARAGAVRDALVRGGLPEDRVIVHAEGESRASETDPDGMALERRVQMHIVDIDADLNRVASTAE